MERTITITFLSDWLISSGLGDGSRADLVLARDENGLPYLPGRGVKGILREAARELGAARPELKKYEVELFDKDEGRESGLLRVGRGMLDKPLSDALLAITDRAMRDRYVNDLTVIRAQTAIEAKTGTAKGKSLRRIECGVPGLSFTCDLELAVEAGRVDWMGKYLRAVCAMARVMGANRYRGLGRCKIDYPNGTGEGAVPAVPVPEAEVTA